MAILPQPTTTAPRSKPTRRSTSRGRMYDVETANGDLVALPSVTTILGVVGKPALVNWAAQTTKKEVIGVAADLYSSIAEGKPLSKANFALTLDDWLGKSRAHEKELARAGNIGTQLHKHIEWTLRRELGQKVPKQPAISKEAMNAFAAWVKWRENVNLEPIHIEQEVYSLEYGFAGTLDLYARVDGKLSVLDWKSGKAIYPEAYLQNAAYRCAFEEMKHGDVERGYIVRLPKTKVEDPKPEAVYIDNGEYLKHLSTFLNAMKLWNFIDQMNNR